MVPRRDNIHGQNYEEHAPDSEFKGGGFRGGPKRWTGKGPRPARHIPWPEIFRHHLSVVEGHEKMIDMIRKHTVEGSNNWRMINVMLDRCREMAQMTKKAAGDFVPPADQLNQVPIGSSSASMYPGYSPADHQYGDAAAEFGRVTTSAPVGSNKLELNPQVEEPEHQGDSTRDFRSGPLAHSGKAAGANAIPIAPRKKLNPESRLNTEKAVNVLQTQTTQTTTTIESYSNPYFIIDTNPTPIHSLVTERVAPTNKHKDEAVAATSQGGKAGGTEKKSKKSRKRKLNETSNDASQTKTLEAAEDLLTKKKKKRKSKENAPAYDQDAAPEVPALFKEEPKKKRKGNKSKSDGGEVATSNPAEIGDQSAKLEREGTSENPTKTSAESKNKKKNKGKKVDSTKQRSP